MSLWKRPVKLQEGFMSLWKRPVKLQEGFMDLWKCPVKLQEGFMSLWHLHVVLHEEKQPFWKAPALSGRVTKRGNMPASIVREVCHGSWLQPQATGFFVTLWLFVTKGLCCLP